MKLHLPLPLRSALLAVCAVSTLAPAAAMAIDSSNLGLTPCEASELESTEAEMTDLYWGTGRNGGSVTLGDSLWKKPGVSWLNHWEQNKNVHLEAESGTVTVNASIYHTYGGNGYPVSAGAPSMKSLSIAAGSATYNFVASDWWFAHIGNWSPESGTDAPVVLSVGTGATLCIEGLRLTVNGAYSGEGLLRVEKGSLIITGKALIESVTLTGGELSLGADSIISNLQGNFPTPDSPLDWYSGGITSSQRYTVGITPSSQEITIVDGNYTGPLNWYYGLTIAGNFTYNTPEGLAYSARVSPLIVNGNFTLNGNMETTWLSGTGSINGKGTLVIKEGGSFEGEMSVKNLVVRYNGANAKTDIRKYTGENVTVERYGQLVLANEGRNIQVMSLHIGSQSSLTVTSGNLIVSENLGWGTPELNPGITEQKLIFTSVGQKLVLLGEGWDTKLDTTSGKLTIVLDKGVLGTGEFGNITMLEWADKGRDFDFTEYFCIELAEGLNADLYKNVILNPDGHVTWGEETSPEISNDLHWGSGQTGGSITLGGEDREWSTQSGQEGTAPWEQDKNVYLEAASGTITVTVRRMSSGFAPTMKNLTVVSGSAVYNLVSDEDTPAIVQGKLSVGTGTTLRIGEGAVLRVNGAYVGEGSLQVENGGFLDIGAETTIKDITLTNGSLRFTASDCTILNLQGSCASANRGDVGINSGSLTIVAGNYTGSLNTHGLTITGNFTYNTPGVNEGEKLENAAEVDALTVDGKLTLNGAMLATSLRGKGSIIGQGTLQLTNSENNSFEGEVGVNLLYAGSSFTLSKYTGKNVTVTSGQLTLSNRGSGIKLETLTFQGSGALIVKDAGSSISGNVTLGENQQLTLAKGASLNIASLTLSGGMLDVSGELGRLNVGVLKTTAVSTLNVGDLSAMAEGSYSVLSYDSHNGADANQLKLQGLENVGTRKSFQLEMQQNALMLVVTGKGADLTWNNSSTRTWSAGTIGGEWVAAQTVPDKHFFNGDNVTFNGAGEVNIQGKVEPGSITVQGDEATTFMSNDDTGSIAGAAQLTKKGEGKLTINTANAYTGGTVVEAGTLVTGNANALGVGGVTLNGGTLDMGGQAVGNTVTVKKAASITNGGAYTGKLTLDGGTLDGAVNLAQDAELKNGTVAGVLSGKGGVVVSGGAVTLSGANTYTGKTTVQGGTLTVSGSVASKEIEVQSGGTYSGALIGPDLTVTLAGGTLKGNVTLDGGISLNSTSAGSMVDGKLRLAQGGSLGVQEGGALTVKELETAGGDLSLGGNGDLKVGTFATTETTTQVNLGMDVLDMESGTYVLLKYDTLAEGSTSDHLRLESRITDERTRKQFNLELKSDSMNLLVSEESASLEWNQGSKGTWENSADGGLWDTETNDKTFFNGDSVTFHAAEEPVEVEVVGGVRPGSISVKGNQDVTFHGSGSITGRGALTKEGSGTLRMKTNNASYGGDISVLGGTLEVGHENALGTGAVLVQNARFDAGNFAVNNPVKLAGTAGLKGANSVKELTFANGSSITADGAYVLGVNQHLLVDGHSKTRSATPVASSFSGGFVFAGGTLSLNGGLFDLTGATVSFNPENGSSTLDLTEWDGLTYGDYTLLQGHEGQWKAGSEALFKLSLDETLQKYAELKVSEDGSSIELVIKRPSEDPAISAALNRNQRAAYKTLAAIAERGTAVGKLAEMADSVANAQDARSAAALVDRLSGAELATILSAQTEGNMAHIRRLRNSIGTGHLVSPKHRTAAYVTGYNEDTQLEQDAKGLGYKRVEWGGTVGVETGLHRRSVMGLALSSGRAYVTPDGGSRRYHEDNTRGDIYMVAYQGLNIRNTFSLGYGVHRFNVSRMLPDGSISKNGNISGNSLNMGEEMAYTIKMNEKTSIEPFFAVESSFNRVNSFTEYGVGTASISAQDSEAWATDLSLGVRTTHAFSVVPSAPSAVFTLQAALVASVGDNWEEMTLNYTGAPDMSYEVRPAKRNRWGFTIGASVGLPVSENFSVIGGANATLRGDSNEFSGSVGLRFNF